MSFRFPLQKIVDLKSNEKTQAEWMLSMAIGNLHKVEQSLAALKLEKNQIHLQLNEAASTNVSISELQNLQDYITYLEQQIKQTMKDHEQAEQAVVQKKQFLHVKMKDEKVWNNVKEKAKLVFEAIERTSEQKIMDEIAINRYKSTF